MDADRAELVAIEGEPECEGQTVVDRGDVRYTISDDPSPWQNGVAFARWRASAVRERAEELLAAFRDRGRPFTWQVGPLTDAPGILEILAEHSLRREVDAFLLVADLPLASWRVARDLRLVEEADERSVIDAITIGRDLDDAAIRAQAERRLRYLACPTRRGGGVVAYRGTLAVGYGRWRDASDSQSVYLSTATTLRPHRRTGVYSTIVAYRLARALRAGRRTAVVVAERSTSAPILIRKGFKALGRVEVWLSPMRR